MGFLMSDTMPLDSLNGATTWMHEGLTDWMYAADATREIPEYESDEPTE